MGNTNDLFSNDLEVFFQGFPNISNDLEITWGYF